jgi:hypothetical protein
MSTETKTNAVTVAPERSLGFVDDAVRTFEGIQKLAEVMAKMGTMPQHLAGKPADCFRVVVQAAKWHMDPFAVAECTSLVHGRMCYEGKLVAAVLQSMGAIEGRLTYDITGKGQQASIIVTGTPRGGKPQALRGSVQEWKTDHKGSPWEKQPETMLVYRGTRQWARMYTPEAILGVYTPDEFDGEPIDVTSTATVRPATPEPARTAGHGVDTGAMSAHIREQIAAKDCDPTLAAMSGETVHAPQVEKPAPAAKPSTHPAVIAARELYRNLGSAGKGIVNRIAALHGADSPASVAIDKLEAFGKDVAEIASCKGDMPAIEDTLGGWENAAKSA